MLNLLKQAVRSGYSWTGIRLSLVPYGVDVLHDIRRLARAMGRSPGVFFDVGANVGVFSRKIVRSFPQAKIYAFEPTPQVFAQLQGNLQRMPGVTPVNLALSAAPGTAELSVYENSHLNSLTPESPYVRRFQPTAEKIVCQVSTVDQFCADKSLPRIDLLKIDTEGADLAVLEGARGMLARGAIDFVYVEFNDIGPRPGGGVGNLDPICALLIPHGFHFVASYTDYLVGEGEFFGVYNALFVRS